MGPELLLATKIGTSVAGGIAAANAAQGEKLRSDINAYVGETRAMQTGSVARYNLESELASIRSTLAANGQRPTSGTFQLMQDVRDVRNRERRIGVGNERRGAMDSRIAGQNASARGRGAIIKGFGQASQSIFDLNQVLGNR
jgi:hypothetical protein